MDKPTPERAIELADEYERQADMHILNSTSIHSDQQWQMERAEECREKAAILRDYSDLRRKWDAVVNAEPVAYMTGDRAVSSLREAESYANWRESMGIKPGIIPLIRKPE